MKRVLYGLGLLVVLLAAGLAIFILTFDANRYRPQIVSLVEQQTGRSFSLGEISLTLWPSLGLDLHDAVLGNPPDFGKRPFARVKTVHVAVELLPLLRRELKVDTLLLDGLQVELIRTMDGHDNWHDLAGKGESGPAEEAASPTEAPAPSSNAASSAPPVRVELNGIEIRNTRIHYNDADTGTVITLDPFELKTGALIPGRPMPIEARLHLTQKPDLALDAALKGKATLNPEKGQYRIDTLELGLSLRAPDLPDGQLKARLEAAARADLSAGTARLDPLRIETLGLVISGKARASDITAEPRWQASLKVAEFSPRTLMKKAGVEAPQTADPGVLQRASFLIEARGDTRQATLEPIRIELDDTTLKGNIRLPDLSSQAVRFDLAVDAIDLDRYLPPPAEDTGKPAPVGKSGGPQAASDDAPIELPMDTLRALDVDGHFSVGRLKAFKARTSDARLHLIARKGVLRIDPLTARLYDGNIRLTTRLDARGKTPKYATTIALKGVQSGPLIKDMAGDEYLSGKADFDMSVTTTGNRPSALKKGLNGKASFAFGEGSVNNSEIAHQVNQVLALLLNQPYDPSVKHVGFTRLTASAKIRQGIIDNRDLELRARKFTVRGLGTVDLPAERIDYELRLYKAGGKTYAPIRISGPLSSPGFRFDKDAWLKQRLEGKKQEAEKRLQQRLDEEVGDRLKGLFGR